VNDHFDDAFDELRRDITHRVTPRSLEDISRRAHRRRALQAAVVGAAVIVAGESGGDRHHLGATAGRLLVQHRHCS
jgi:hypothetical protein